MIWIPVQNTAISLSSQINTYIPVCVQSNFTIAREWLSEKAHQGLLAAGKFASLAASYPKFYVHQFLDYINFDINTFADTVADKLTLLFDTVHGDLSE